LVLKVLDIDSTALECCSDKICTALQLTNFWQDLSVDLARDRLYLPLEDLERFGVSLRALRAGYPPASFGALVRFEVERTKRLFRRGRSLLTHGGFPGSLYFSAVWIGGRAVLRMVRETSDRILFQRPAISAWSLANTVVGAGLDRLPVSRK
jgi:phytoene/squalene synthetase